VHHALDNFAEYAAALHELIEKHGKDSPYQVAEVHASCRDYADAIEWLERAYGERDPGPRLPAHGSVHARHVRVSALGAVPAEDETGVARRRGPSGDATENETAKRGGTLRFAVFTFGPKKCEARFDPRFAFHFIA
jgi:hypothetical protein